MNQEQFVQEQEMFEKLSLKDQLSYVNKHGVIQKRFNSVLRTSRENFGKFYFAYEVQNGYGWRFARASTKEESDRLYNEWVNKRS